MSESPTPSPQKSSPTAIRAAWIVLILATLYVCYFSHLGAIGFVGPDEPRYAWIARAMTETGDWVTPRLYGQPWFEKPPLFYWGAALSFKLFGVSEAAARLPSAISALLATLALAWLALRMDGAETARWFLLLLPTTVGMIGFSHAAATDMPFSAMLTIAMVCAAVVLRIRPASSSEAAPIASSRASEWFALFLFGFFLGLAVLAKGPAGVILCGGAVLFWAIFTKRWRDAFRLLHPAAIAAFCITAFPWYVLCARRNPDFFRVFIIEHNFKRYLTPEFQHIQPFWYYIPIVIIALFPWSIGVTRFFKDAVQVFNPTNWPNAPRLFLACWTLFPIVFFSFSKSKLPGYVLPAILPGGLVIAQSVSRRTLKILPGASWIRVTVGLSLILLGVFGELQVERIPLAWPTLFVTLGGSAVLILNDLRRGLIVGVCTLVLVFASAPTGETREVLDQRYSARNAPQTARVVWNDFSLERSSTYKLTRSFQYALNFYSHRELPNWSPGRSGRSWVFALANEEFELRNRGLNCPFNALRHAVIVCEDPGLPPGPASSRKPQ